MFDIYITVKEVKIKLNKTNRDKCRFHLLENTSLYIEDSEEKKEGGNEMSKKLNLNGEWNAFHEINGKAVIHNNYKVFITQNCCSKKLWIQESSEKENWANIGYCRFYRKLKPKRNLTIKWGERSDSKGKGKGADHCYKVRIIDENLIQQISKGSKEEKFSYGFWVRENIDMNELNELIAKAKKEKLWKN